MTTISDVPASAGTPEADPADLDQLIGELHEGADRWAQLGLAQRADLLLRARAAVAQSADAWVAAAVAAKHTPDQAVGEEWFSGPYATLSALELVANSLLALSRGASPAEGVPVKSAPGDRVAFEVLPASLTDRLLLSGFTAEVWMAPGISAEQARADAGLGARHAGENGGVGLVLGAGNISSIGPLDVLYELVAFNRASILKLNPTFASLLPVYEAALAPLIEAGVLRIVRGGAQTGGYLAAHERIAHVHITGSGVTHDAIVWGTGEEAQQRRAAGTPLLHTPISSELGGVSPIIVVPGAWTERDLRYQAEQVATMRTHNGGHNCIAGQVLVMSSDWPQRDEFLGHLRVVLDELPARGPWYPGAQAKIDAAVAAYPAAERRGTDGDIVLIEVGEHDEQTLCTTEYFATVLGHTALPGTGGTFLRNAVQFANDRLVGTLGANVLIAPRDLRALGDEFDEIIAELRYGTVAVNVWTALAFLTAACPWGAFPGNPLDDVGSGIGVVHNALLLDNVERTVVRGPFREAPRSLSGGELALGPRPPWFVTNTTGAKTAELMTRFVADPSWLKLPGIFASGLRG